MPGPITLRVLTEAGLVIEDQAVSVIAPGELGYLGMLANHAPLVTTIQPGTLTWRTPTGQTKTARVESGLLEIAHNHLTLFTNTVSDLGSPSES